MIKKILIANRGAIAARIIKTCQRLNIKTVAIYSEADAALPYVNLADESYLIGPPPVKESYLNIEKIIKIAKRANSDAIHPGYGFMSENPKFVKRCHEENIIFIGPNEQAIEQMGNKILARQLVEEAGVPVIPGSHHLSDLNSALEIAAEIGYPVMLKAAAGGGGIGMNIVRDENELKNSFESNQQRAETYFGNRELYMEKLLTNTRHIEFQILADSFGHVIHLYERECSIQRRHQKVIEETPSPGLTDNLRQEMGTAAIHLAKQLQYTNAGTIEFLVDDKNNFYFLEMNTRIQVEHGITEEVTHVDIVEQQINIAAGKKINYEQHDIKIDGHAIEVRIYAEDPQTFFPSPGTISQYNVPKGDHIRLDSTVKEESTVTPFYDPMISKLIVFASSRHEAIEKMDVALTQYIIEGIKTNIPMAQTILNHEKFRLGHTYTHFVEKFYMN